LGIAFIPYFPLASGLLTGKYRRGKPIPKGTRLGEGSDLLSEENLATVEELARFAESKRHSLLDLAMGWLLSHRAVASVIAGATKPDQVRSNAAATNWRLSADERAAVDALAVYS
jgi:aryl-alcohol dehydrogenase-like predicted oxidoreductase